MRYMRQFSARFLLALFISMLLLQTVHHHETAAKEESICSLCVAHKQHAGHLAAQTSFTCECLLCQLFETSYIAPAETMLSVCVGFISILLFFSPKSEKQVFYKLHNPRGPPMY